MVVDWNKFIDTINEKNTISLNTEDMLLPTLNKELDDFWINFNRAITKALKLEFIYLHKCPPFVVENVIKTLPQLKVLHALYIGYIIDNSPSVFLFF